MRYPSISVIFRRNLRQLVGSRQECEKIQVLGKSFEADSMTNITPAIQFRLQQKLLHNPFSPLSLLRDRIRRHFEVYHRKRFKFFQLDDPIVTTQQNFDELLIPPSHPSRSVNDSYYINRKFMLRTHMTAHEQQVMANGEDAFLLVGDVYRRDEIDCTHMPVFHQLEGVRIFTRDELLSRHEEYETTWDEFKDVIDSRNCPPEYDPSLIRCVLADLYKTLQGLMRSIFGTHAKVDWQETFFPFTQPSLEAGVDYRGKYIEMLGSGVLQKVVLHPKILHSNPNAIGWAFGLGLERVAMVLHEIPDIRLFWSDDVRFTSQFKQQLIDGAPIKFSPFSKYPPIYKDISFFVDDYFHANDFYEIIRELAPELVESVELIDEFKLDNQSSRCYRITYRATDKTLTDEFVNELQTKIRNRLAEQLNIRLR